MYCGFFFTEVGGAAVAAASPSNEPGIDAIVVNNMDMDMDVIEAAGLFLCVL